MSTKGRLGFFKILFRSWVIEKPGLCEWVETKSFLTLTNTSRSEKKNEKNPKHFFVDICK